MSDNQESTLGDDLNINSNLESQIDIWRAKALNALLLVAILVFTPAIVVWLFQFNSLQDILESALVYFAIYLLTVGLALFRQIDYRLRAWVLILLTYFTGAQAMILGGLAGDGRIYLLVVPIMALIVVGARAGAIMSGMVILTYSVLAGAASKGWITDRLLFKNNPVDLNIWVQEGIVMFACLAMVVVLQWRFNQFLETMASKNVSLYDEVSTIANELEQRVDERTAELQETNEKLKSREKKLRLAMADADKANSAKSEFLSRMSHELRAPMNLVLGFAQILEMDQQNPLTSAQQKSVRYILDEGEYLLKMIDELLDISRIEAGHIEISKETVDLGAVVDALFNFCSPLLSRHNVQMELHPSIQQQIYVSADKQRLHQVLLNLISNAIKFNRSGGEVSLSIQHQEPRTVRINVHDTGIGIHSENLGDLFTPFVRLDDGGSKPGGTGLGLSLSKQLMDLMNGDIGVESTPGNGSIFWIELPLADHYENHLVADTQTEDTTEIGLPAFTLLYIEDYRPNYELLKNALAQYPQANLLWASDGQSGLAMASQLPDLILLDLQLPDMHGFDVLRQLKQDDSTSKIPIVVLSADATQYQIKFMKDAGALDYVTKPYKMREMIQNLHTWLS